MATPEEILPFLQQAVDARRTCWEATRELEKLITGKDVDGVDEVIDILATSSEGQPLDLDDVLTFSDCVAGLINDDDEEEEAEGFECSVCENDVDIKDRYSATPCGSFCDECMTEHAKECEVCRKEFEISVNEEIETEKQNGN